MTAHDSLSLGLGLSLALFCPVLVAEATAQPSRVAMAADRKSSAVAVVARWLDDPTSASVLAPRVYATAAPNTYQVISVSIPESLPRTGAGNVEITARPGFTILGTHKWSLVDLTGKSRLVVTIGVPSNAAAGVLTAAEAQFHVPGTPTVAVAIQIEILLVRDLAVRIQTGSHRGRAGTAVAFSYELVNGGNASEIIETPITAPKGWTVKQPAGARASVARGESTVHRVVVSIPRKVATGSFFLRLDVVERGIVRSSIPIGIEVLDGLLPEGSAGPEVLIAVARGTDASGRGGTITSTRIHGPLFDSVRIDARFSVGQAVAGPAGIALARLGAFQIAPTIELSAPSGRLTLGAAGTSFSDLTGLYAYGRGALLETRRSGWHLVGLGAMSDASLSSGRSQPMAGVRVDVDAGRAEFRSSFSHLRAGELSPRRLDAASFGASIDAGFGTSLHGDIARRTFAGGTGTGWSAALDRKSSQNNAELHVTHAPGGSDAFARAVHEIVANISQRISNRLSVSGSAWQLSDATAVFDRLRSRGWTLRPEYRVHSSTTVALDAYSSGATAVTSGNQYGAASGYGSAERRVGASVNSNVGHFYATASVAGGSAARTIGRESSTLLAERSPTIWWNTLTSWRGSASVIEFQGRMEEKRDLSGAVLRPSTVALRGSHSIGSVLGRGTEIDGEIQQLRGISARPITVLHAGVTIPIMPTLAVKLYSERNPLFVGGSGRAPWVFAFRVEHSTHLPIVRLPGSTGYVYRDLNGNQKRDTGEPGVDGAVLKRGAETAITDANGKYRLAGDTRSAIVLDEGSLPLGWIRQTIGSQDIAVGTNVSVEIRFVVAPRSSIDVIDVDLSGMRAVARDASGRQWVARMTGPTVASFEALPPGTYTLELDVTDVAEPLVPRLPLPLLHVTALEASFVTIVLDPRPLRMWRAQAAPSGGQP